MLRDCLESVGRAFLLLIGTASVSLPESSSIAELFSCSVSLSRSARLFFFGLSPSVREDDLDSTGTDDAESRPDSRRTGVSGDGSLLAGGADP